MTDQTESLRKAAEFFKVDVPEYIVPQDRHVLAGLMRLHHLDWGTEGKPPVLLMHGSGLTAHTWTFVSLLLRQSYHIRAADLRGHGDSEWSPGMHYGVWHHATDIENLADALGLENYVLVGMSLGGLASILYAGRNAARLRGLVIVDIAPRLAGSGGASPRGIARINNFVRREDEHESVDDFVKQALAFNPRRDPDLLRSSLLNNLRQLSDGRWTWKYDRRHHGRAGMEVNPDAMKELGEGVANIACPTLLVRGAQSDVLSAEAADAFVKALPNGRLEVVENAGHTVQGDNPTGFVNAVRPFLDSL